MLPFPPEFLIADFIWPENPKDPLQAAVDERLDPVQCLLCYPPCLRAIEKDRFIKIGVLVELLILIMLVFFLFILSPTPRDVSASLVVFSCICLWLCAISARSSAKSRSSSCVHRVHCMPFFFTAVVVFMIQSITSRNMNGDRRHPCRTPVLILKLYDTWPACSTLHVIPW